MNDAPPHPSDSTFRPGPHRVALVAAAMTWPLLLVGGSVTVYRVGMAVPDWPTTFGINMFLYDFLNAPWGVYLEHSHRLFGAAVGLACVVLAGWFVAAERRTWMKWLGVFALIAVVGQGFLGGYRVRHNSTELALIHGCAAQAFFALMVALVVLTGRVWSAHFDRSPDDEGLRLRSAFVLMSVYGQVVAGAVLRHYGDGLLVHAGLAAAVAIVTLEFARCTRHVPALVPATRAMVTILVGQVALGIASWLMLRPFDGMPKAVTSPQALVRIGHQGLGALLLASAVVATLRAFRHLTAPTRVIASERLEVVA